MPSENNRTSPVSSSASRGVVGIVESATEWDDLVARAQGVLAQTWHWGELKRVAGWSPLRIGWYGPDGLSAGAQILTRRLGLAGSIGYLDGGPLVARDGAPIGTTWHEPVRAGCREGGIRALIIDPPSDPDPQDLLALGYVPSPIKTSLGATVRVDLSSSEDELLAGMKAKARYNVRKGSRSGVSVRPGTTEDVAEFHRLLVATADRQGFVPPTRAYLDEMWRRLAPDGRLAMFLAEVEGATVAGILLTAAGETVTYKRGAWDGSMGAAHPNEVLHWEAMRWARNRGFRWYDFDGVERDVAESLLAGAEPPLTSVARFKLGFGGAVVLLPQSMVFVPNRVLRAAFASIMPRLLNLRRVKQLVRTLRSR